MEKLTFWDLKVGMKFRSGGLGSKVYEIIKIGKKVTVKNVETGLERKIDRSPLLAMIKELLL